MIQLKMKATKTTNELFGSQIKPYTEKVINSLGKTSIRQELIVPLETAIRQKTKKDTEKLEKHDDFATYKTIYMTNSRHMIENLRENNEINNIDLINKVNSGIIDVNALVDLRPEDMHSERWKALVEKKLSEMEKLTKDPEATTNLFWCSKCHRNNCKFFERQDRCADEPMTIHITCCFCGHKWRQ
jgi:DNA-directed RNA polymerase subunit M/transcription elongation factor TFIIS